MFGMLKTIFGSGDVISKGIDLIDGMHTSTEEEIKAKSGGSTLPVSRKRRTHAIAVLTPTSK